MTGTHLARLWQRMDRAERAVSHDPSLAPLLLPLALAIAASRVVLGLHYPSDVAAGALIGAALAEVTTRFWPI